MRFAETSNVLLFELMVKIPNLLVLNLGTGSSFADIHSHGLGTGRLYKPRIIENIVVITIPNSDRLILDIEKIDCSN